MSGDARQGVYRRAGRKGFGFTVMVAGERCLGKSTMIETLFGDNGGQNQDTPNSPRPNQPTVRIEQRTMDMTVEGAPVKLTVVDTPARYEYPDPYEVVWSLRRPHSLTQRVPWPFLGFGDSVDTRDDVGPLENYIDAAFREYLQGESQADRSGLIDRRVHCLLYFIRGSTTGLQPLDLQALKQLHTKVNIVPVLAKADTLTMTERESCKSAVQRQIRDEGITVFHPGHDVDDEAEVRAECEAFANSMPFAVIGSTERHDVAGKNVRGRKYGWGVAEVDSTAHCDFVSLRRMLVETHLHDLKGVTEEVHYETFRKTALEQGTVAAPEVTAVFSAGRTAEQELQRKHEDMKRDLEEQARLLEEKRRQFEEERKLYDEAKRSQNIA